MRIGIAGSMHHVEKMIEIRDQLIDLGHDAFTSSLTDTFVVYAGLCFKTKDFSIKSCARYKNL